MDYFSAPGLSNSGMSDLLVSPLRYWYLHVNPNRPVVEPTPAMQFGSALHCAVLEPDEFLNRYACRLVPEGGWLVTIEDLRGWLRDQGATPKGTRKADVIAQCQSIDADIKILEIEERRYYAEHEGKALFAPDDWARICGAAEALMCEPRFAELVRSGQAEVPMFAADPKTGVALKGKLDWVTPDCTLDVKTFSAFRGKPIDRAVTDAIWYEHYYRQAYFYSLIRSLSEGDSSASGAQKAPACVMAFVESEPPHEVRFRELRPRSGGEVSLLWERARLEVREMIRLYADCMERFGAEPWRTPQEVDPIMDEEIKALAYGGVA